MSSSVDPIKLKEYLIRSKENSRSLSNHASPSPSVASPSYLPVFQTCASPTPCRFDGLSSSSSSSSSNTLLTPQATTKRKKKQTTTPHAKRTPPANKSLNKKRKMDVLTKLIRNRMTDNKLLGTIECMTVSQSEKKCSRELFAIVLCK